MGPYKSALIAAVVVCGAARAQDTRNVTEPKFPASCAVLPAQVVAIDGGKTVADADEPKLDTARIQKAIDGCAKGQAVELRAEGARNAFVAGPLDLRSGVTLRIGAGVTLFASRDPKVYDVRPGLCGNVDKSGRGCRALINGAEVEGAGVMGEGTIDGRGWAKMLGKDVSWWDIAEQARNTGNQNCPRLVVIQRSKEFTLYKVRLKNSPNFHVTFNGDGFTAWGVIIDTPGKGARNTDGIDPSGATNVTIAHCYIHTGDDNVALKAGARLANVTVAHNHFYTGHGMSIGSETNGGAEKVLVTDLSIDGADNGLRIKSNSTRGGLVKDIVYRDVCIRNTKNPILMDSDYEKGGREGGKLPHFTAIELHDVRVEGGGKITLQGFDETHRLGMTFDNVQVDPTVKVAAEHAELTFGPGPVNLKIAGPDVAVKGNAGNGAAPNACTAKFVELPQSEPRP
jgi:polygalacturonase